LRANCISEDEYAEKFIYSRNFVKSKKSDENQNVFHHTLFLYIKDKNIYRDYRNNQKENLYWPTVAIGLSSYLLISVTRCSIILNLFQLGLYFNISQSMLILMGGISGIFLISHILLVNCDESSRSYKFGSYVIFTFANGHIEDLMIILAALVVGFFLLARVMAGPCDENMNVYQQQRCNPKSTSNSLPNDSVLLVQLLPVIAPIILRGISRWGALFSFMISLGFLITCEVLVSGFADSWTISYTFFCLLTSYETQRTKLTNFLQNKTNLIQQICMAERELEHQRQVAEILQKSAEFEKEQLRRICGNVAHDLKTPIQSIAIGIESIKTNFLIPTTSDGNLNSRRTSVGVSMDASPLLDVLSASCTFMTMAVNRAIDFTKACGNMSLKPSMSPFNAVNDMMLPISCIKCLQSDVTIITDVQSDVLINSAVQSDQQWFCENILCLLSNAVKYSDGGVVNVVIDLQKQPFKLPATSNSSNNDSEHDYPDTLYSLKSNDCPTSPGVEQYVVVSVEDCGIGVHFEVMENLFKPLSQTDRLAGGAGLGLYSLQHRVAALGVQCGALNRTDGRRGSVFWFSFPYISVPQLSAAASSNTSVLPPRRPSNSKGSLPPLGLLRKSLPSKTAALRILLVDDSLPILKMIQSALEKLGHQVFTAKNGARGLAEMQRLALQPAGHEYGSTTGLDLVLMDIQMPVMDGIEATRRFRELEALSTMFDNRTPMVPSSTSKSDMSVVNVEDATESLCLSAAASAAIAFVGVADLAASGNGLVSNRGSRQFTGEGCKNRHLAIIGMSANSDPVTKSMALAAGMDNFMPKPFSLKEFEFVVQQLRIR